MEIETFFQTKNPVRRKRINFFDCHIDPLTMTETLEIAEEVIKHRQITQHVVINVAKFVAMQKNEDLRGIINNCGLINADGQGIIWGARIEGIKIPERVTGIDLMSNLIRRAAEKNYKIYLLGAGKKVVKKVEFTLTRKYPNLKIAGYNDGYFSEADEKNIVENIRISQADILFVAMGSPDTEYFLNKYLHDLNVPFSMGVGGSFDIIAGKTRRAPIWMQKVGLEWFFRFLLEPGRMWKRYFVTNSIYLGLLLKQIFLPKKKS